MSRCMHIISLSATEITFQIYIILGSSYRQMPKILLPATIPHPIIVPEKATCICVAMAAPAEIPDTDIPFLSTLYLPV